MRNVRTFGWIAIAIWITCCLVSGGASARALESSIGSAQLLPQPTIARREISAVEYRKYRDQSLSHAKSRMGAKVNNPGVSKYGFSPEIVATLQEQQDYLRRSSFPSPDDWQGQIKPRSASSHRARPTLLPRKQDSPLANSGHVLVASPCRSAAIHSVNGRSKEPIFTPQPPNNFYRIEGCGFGILPGRVQLESDLRSMQTGPQLLPIGLQLDSASSWSENEIRVYLDPRLTAISDSAVTLVVYPGSLHSGSLRSSSLHSSSLHSGNKGMQLPGCRFVARRGESHLLAKIPASWVKLHATTTSSRPRQIEYVSPPTHGLGVPGDATVASALVLRSDPDEFGAGTDAYDFSHLNTGWVVDSIQIQYYSVSCPGDVLSTSSFGEWNPTWSEHGFALAWASNACNSYIPPVFSFKLSSSQYAVRVWVTGPVGTAPMNESF